MGVYQLVVGNPTGTTKNYLLIYKKRSKYGYLRTTRLVAKVTRCCRNQMP